MNIALVVGGVPDPASGGGALTAHTVVRHLVDAGHAVALVILHDERFGDPLGRTVEERLSPLQALGVATEVVTSRAGEMMLEADRNLGARLRRALHPPDLELFPTLADADVVRATLRGLEPDAVFVYHFEALAATRGLAIPRVAGVGDPPHLPAYYRWRAELPRRAALRQTLRIQALVRHQPGLAAGLLSECDSYGAFAAHHAAQLRRRGAPSCRYLRTPVPDPGEARGGSSGGVPRLLLLGHLKGVVTLQGLEMAGRIWPLLDRVLGPDGYVVDVVGGHEPPARLASVLEHPAVVRHGHVEDPAPFLRSADVLLVPSSIPLGIRVRILTGLAHGSCVVTHVANALGIPELADGENALLADSAAGLGNAILAAIRDEDLRRRLGAGARATYERSFAPSVAAHALEEQLEGVARATIAA